MKELFALFFTFARIGAFTFGGGYAMLPLLQREVVHTRHWATEEEVLDYFAIGQCTPGIIFINTATFIGYKQKGVLGAIFATLGSIFPSLIIILIIASVLTNFAHLPMVQYAFGGIRVVVGVLILNAVAGMWKKSVIDGFGIILAILSFFVITLTDLSPIWLVIVGAVLGIVLQAFRATHNNHKGGEA